MGTEKILDSGHVSEGPGRIMASPVPSVFLDDRGTIHRLRIGHQRVNLLYSLKDSMRSGYLHNVLTHDFVISGRVQVWTLAETGTEKKEYGPHEYFTIDVYVPHILFFLEDTNMVEWYEGGATEFKLWYYHPYRNIVNIQNSALASKSSPRHQRLVLKDEEPMTSNANSGGIGGGSRGVSRTTLVFWTATALAVGWVIGVVATAVDPAPSAKTPRL